MSSTLSLDVVMEKPEVLREVQFLHDDDLYSPIAVRMRFEVTEVYLVVHPDDDTVVVTSEMPTIPDGARWIAPSPSWLEAIGGRLQWYWRLENNQGYWDAVQLQFTRDIPGGASVIIQVMAGASMLSILTLVQVA